MLLIRKALSQLDDMMTLLNKNMQPQITQIPKSRIKVDLAIGLGFCAFILLALSGFYLWKFWAYNGRSI